MVPLAANGQLAAAAYHRSEHGIYQPFAIVVLATTLTRLTRISLFAEPALFARFGRSGPGSVARSVVGQKWKAGVGV
jgi:RNA polymerase sigma-70 factor, ECF subfamily